MTLSELLWSDPARTVDTVVKTAVVYLTALALFRFAGRRTLAQLSAFDVVVTIAAGTVVGSTALPLQPTVSDGLTVLLVLLVLQVAIGAARQRSRLVRRLVDFAPQPVVRDGSVDARTDPRTAQLTDDDVRALLRRSGVSDLEGVRLALLEPTGKLSVLPVGADSSGLFARWQESAPD